MLWQLSSGACCRTARTALYLHKAVPSARSHSHSKGYHSKREETPSRPVCRKGIWMLMGIWTAPKPKYPWRVRNSRILQLHTSSSRHHRSDRATYRPLLVKMCLAKQTGIQTGSICRNGIGLWNVHDQQNPSNSVITVNNLTSMEIWQDFVVLSWFKRRIRVQPSGPSGCASAQSTQGLQLSRITGLYKSTAMKGAMVQDWGVCDTMWNPSDPITAQSQALSFYLTILCLPRADLSTAPQPRCHPLPREGHSDALKRSSLPAWNTSEGSILFHITQSMRGSSECRTKGKKKEKKKGQLWSQKSKHTKQPLTGLLHIGQP